MVPAASPETCVFSLGAENHIPAFGVPLVQSLLCLLGGHHSPEHWLVWEFNCPGSQVLAQLPLVRSCILCIVSHVGRLVNNC